LVSINLVPLKTLDKDEKTGLIVESGSGEKIVTFRTATFLHLMDRFVELLGDNLSATFLHQMGIDVGRSMLTYTKGEVKSDNDLCTVMDVIMAERGWGRCLALEKAKMRGLTYTVKVGDNPISHKHGGNQPICNFLRGNYTGFLEAYLNKKAQSSVQVACAGLTAPNCVFEIAF
jgi:predicted hydrocarbon binding protein